MAGPPSLPGQIWQVRLIGEMHGQKTVNVLHFTTPGAVDDMELRLIIVLANCFLTHLKPVFSADFTMKEIRYQFVSSNPPGIEFVFPIVGGTGAGSGAALPSFCSAVIGLQSIIGGRSGKGRVCFAGIPEDQTVDSTIDPASPLWAGLIGFAGCVAAAFVHPGAVPANGVVWALYSRKLGGATFPFTIGGAQAVKVATPRSQIGSINSRKVGRGA